MRVALVAVLYTSILLPSAAQQIAAPIATQAPQRDTQAVAVLQSAITAMGKGVPSDSVATGNVTIVAGSLTTSGTIRILTRGTDQTSEQFSVPEFTRKTIYSRLAATENDDAGNSTSLPLERSVTTRSLFFPLPFLNAALSNPDEAIEYVGLESQDFGQAQHVRVWNTFNSTPWLRFLSDFTVADIWLDPTTSLPREICFIQRNARGAVPRIAVRISYANFQNVKGVLYPYEIQESINGTPWATITIQSVAFTAGLTDTDFPVQQAGN